MSHMIKHNLITDNKVKPMFKKYKKWEEKIIDKILSLIKPKTKKTSRKQSNSKSKLKKDSNLDFIKYIPKIIPTIISAIVGIILIVNIIVPTLEQAEKEYSMTSNITTEYSEPMTSVFAIIPYVMVLMISLIIFPIIINMSRKI